MGNDDAAKIQTVKGGETMKPKIKKQVRLLQIFDKLNDENKEAVLAHARKKAEQQSKAKK